MNIFLTIRGKSGAISSYVTEDFLHLTAKEVFALAADGLIGGIRIVRRGGYSYIRTARNESVGDNLSSKAVDGAALQKKIKIPNKDTEPKVATYVELYGSYLESRFSKGELIYLDKVARATTEEVTLRIQPLKKLILAAAQKNGVDPNLVTAILIDEYARMGPDDLLDLLARIGIDTTVGLPQMRMSTAREMVELKLVKLETGISNSELYAALQDDKYAADFVAAYVNNIVKIRTRRHWNIAPEFIATCYSKGPATSESSDRGKQIVTTLLQVAMEILR